MFKRLLEDYIRVKVCWSCCHTRFYWDKERNHRTFISKREDETCNCNGYPHPHRPGAKFCIRNPKAEFNTRVMRFGEDAEEVALDIAFNSEPGTGQIEPPF